MRLVKRQGPGRLSRTTQNTLMSLYFIWRALGSPKQEKWTNQVIRYKYHYWYSMDNERKLNGRKQEEKATLPVSVLLTSHPCQVAVWFREKYLRGLFVVHQGKVNWRQLCGAFHCHEGTMDATGAMLHTSEKVTHGCGTLAWNVHSVFRS